MTEKIAEFNASHSDVQINYTILIDDYMNSIQLAYQANTAPDIMSISASDGITLGDYVTTGMFESLSSYIAASSDFQTVNEPYDHMYQNLNCIDDEIYWMPTGVRSGTRIEYNIGLLQEAGYDSVPDTLEGMVEAAAKITENGNGSYYGVGFTNGGFGRWLEGIGEMSGYNHQGYDYTTGTFDFSEWQELLELAAQFYANGYVLPGSETQGVDNNRALFAQGSFCFWGNASQEAGVFTDQFPCDFDWGVSELPTMDGTVKGALNCTPNFGWVMLSSAVDKDAAWEVIEFFGSEEFLKGYYEGGYSAPISSYMADKYDASKAGRIADFALQDYEDVYPAVPAVTVEGDGYATVMWNVVLGNVSAADAIADLNTRYNAALESGLANGSCQRLIIEDFDKLNPSAGTCVYSDN
jgi:multiple sugar transport system substrate-binding protein